MVDELNKAYSGKILDIAGLEAVIGSIGKREKKFVLCHGVFDVVHPGHIRHLAYAKSRADVLVVSITCDRWVEKGAYRPHVPESLRALSLAALEMVDFVLIDKNKTPIENLKILKPDFFAKGFEYSDNLPEATLEEMDIVSEFGGSVLFTPGDVVYSSTKLINQFTPSLKMEKLEVLMQQFDLSLDKIRETVNSLAGQRVHVVGDTIIDTYTRTVLIGGNTKTPTFSVLFDSKEDYVGGAGIVSQHMKAAGADVIFTTLLGDDDLGRFAQDHLKNAGIELNVIIDEGRPTTNKNAIIADGYRLLKIDTLDNATIVPDIRNQFQKKVKETQADCIVFSDFRHGIFNRNTVKMLISAIPDGALTVADSQVASRWGNITEFENLDLVTPNEREARFALADQDSNIVQLSHTIKDRTGSSNVILKLGPRGLFFLSDNSYQYIDSFATNVKDAVGSGDALLAYATLTLRKTGSLAEACFVGAVAAACECEFDGNIPISPDLINIKIDEIEKAIQ